jgi:hypothetical protein
MVLAGISNGTLITVLVVLGIICAVVWLVRR